MLSEWSCIDCPQNVLDAVFWECCRPGLRRYSRQPDAQSTNVALKVSGQQDLRNKLHVAKNKSGTWTEQAPKHCLQHPQNETAMTHQSAHQNFTRTACEHNISADATKPFGSSQTHTALMITVHKTNRSTHTLDANHHDMCPTNGCIPETTKTRNGDENPRACNHVCKTNIQLEIPTPAQTWTQQKTMVAKRPTQTKMHSSTATN